MRRGFTIHHNGPPANCIGKPHSRCVAFWEAVVRYHTVDKGWSGVAYSFGVCPHGERFEGQGWNRRQFANGIDLVGANDGADSEWYTVLVFVGGDTSTGDTEPPTREMVVATAALIEEGRHSARCGMQVKPHSDFKRKPCPGPEFTELARAWDNATLRLPPQFANPQEDEMTPDDRKWMAEQLGKTAAAIVTGKGNALANPTQPGWGWLADNPASIADVAAALASIDVVVDVDPEDIQALADAIPDDIARQVADLLHARLAG